MLAEQDLLLDTVHTGDPRNKQADRDRAMGIMTEFVRKSKKSSSCIPMIFTPASGP